jgi:hypothetical protein
VYTSYLEVGVPAPEGYVVLMEYKIALKLLKQDIYKAVALVIFTFDRLRISLSRYTTVLQQRVLSL